MSLRSLFQSLPRFPYKHGDFFLKSSQRQEALEITVFFFKNLLNFNFCRRFCFLRKHGQLEAIVFSGEELEIA